MLRRKIEQTFSEWKAMPGHKPLIVKGCRQCGKTSSVLAFARRAYESVVYLNFFENPNYALAFKDTLDVDSIIMMLSAHLGGGAAFVPGKTVLILDEIQDCPEARTALKFFHLDGRYDVIGTGSLLGVKGYGKEPKSVPVGFETVVEMHPMDFEEFLWANGISEETVALLGRSLEEVCPVPMALHERMRQLLLQYVIVGGMPDVVQTFVNTKRLDLVLQMQRDIVRSYEDDMVKYAERGDRSKIKECFRSIPRQLSKENKKFQYSLIQKSGRSGMFAGCLQWIEDAGIVVRCHNLLLPELPLDGYAMQDVFKVYMGDTGLFVSMLEEGTQADILQGNLYGYKGAIFENLVADIFSKMGRKLYYFRKDSGLEVDFVMRYKGEATLVEVKATSGTAKSARTILKNTDKYHISRAIKLGDYNMASKDGFLILPLYCAFLLRQV